MAKRNEDTLILEEFLLKRCKRSITSTKSYMFLLFELKPTKLFLYDTTPEKGKPGKLKQTIDMQEFRAVEYVEENTISGRTAFQIVYVTPRTRRLKQLVAAVAVKEQQDKWVNALITEWRMSNNPSFNAKYHPGAWDYRAGCYPCCRNVNNQSDGCHRTVCTPSIDEPIYSKHQMQRIQSNPEEFAGYESLVQETMIDTKRKRPHSQPEHSHGLGKVVDQKESGTGAGALLSSTENPRKMKHPHGFGKSDCTLLSLEEIYDIVPSVEEIKIGGTVGDTQQAAIPRKRVPYPEDCGCESGSADEYDYVPSNWDKEVPQEELHDEVAAVGATGTQQTAKTPRPLPPLPDPTESTGMEARRPGHKPSIFSSDDSCDDDDDYDSNYVAMAYTGTRGVQKELKEDLKQYPWFYPHITRAECEDILNKEGKVGCFLVRKSSQKNCFALSLFYIKREHGVIEHYMIRRDRKCFFHMLDEPPRKRISEIIQRHQTTSGELAVRLLCYPDQDDKDALDDLIDFEIQPGDLEMGSVIGRGAFGVVRKAILKKKHEVAVKKLHVNNSNRDEFIAEAKTMIKLRHHRVVRLYGVVLSGPQLQLVTELMTHGSLSDYLSVKGDEILMEPERSTSICLQICQAMEYLESKNVIHRDLAARNCLVTSPEFVKVGDLGLARFNDEGIYVGSYGTQFAVQWAAPEVLKKKIFTSKSDVWSFGVVMWEVYTAGNERPFAEAGNLLKMQEMLFERKEILHQPSHCDEEMYEIMKKCWAFEAVERPTFAVLRREFARVQELYDDYTRM